MNRVWACILSIAAMLFIACGGEEHAGGPGSETTNGIYAKILNSDGSAAANMGVALRRADYSPDTLKATDSVIIADGYTDSTGTIRLDSLPAGNYRITVLSTNESFSREISVTDTAETELDTIMLAHPGSIKGKVYLPQGSGYAWIGIYGLDILVKSDSTGTFTLPALPAGMLRLFCRSADYAGTIEDPDIDVVSDSTVSWTSIYPSMQLESFDKPAALRSWYFSADTAATITFPTTDSVKNGIVYDTTRNSYVFHGTYKAPYGSWVILGLSLADSALDFSGLDSIVLYVKGTAAIRVSLENWHGYGNSGNLQAWTSDTWLSPSSWQRLAVKPSNFLTASEDTNSTGWESVKGKVRQFHIFAEYGIAGADIYIDDIRFYGVKF